MKRSLLVLMLLVTGPAGCNTVGGIGRDIESVGDTVSDAAR